MNATDKDNALLEGGAKSRGAIARLCGLARKGVSWRLDGVWADGGRLRLAVSDPKGAATVYLSKAPTENYFLRAGSFDISYEGASASPELARLLRTIAERLKDKKPEELSAVLMKDPESKSCSPTAAASAQSEGDPDSQGISDRLGGNPGQWRRFFCDREFNRHSFWQGSSGFAGKVLYFVHADYDCSFMPPDITFRGMTFLNYPPVHPHSSDTPAMDTHYEHWTSELKDKDVVLGTDHKLKALMEQIKTRVKPDLIMIQWSCVPTIIGDDRDALADMCREAGGCPVLTNTIQKRLEEGGNYSPFEELFDQLREDPRFLGTPRDENAVNLVDCPPYFFDDELKAVLDEAGVRVNFRIFPTVDLKGVRGYLAARCQVLPDYFKDVPTVQRSLGELDLQTHYAPAPFGIADTREYVLTAVRPFGPEAEEKAFRRLDAELEKLRAKWEALSREASKYRVAFVVEADNIPQVLRPEFLTGIPVARIVAEMGFSADFLVHAPGGRLPKEAEELKKQAWFKTPPSVTGFSDREGLRQALEDGTFRSVYSDIFFDRRISRAGKTQFSMRTFEAGLAGAVRSLERMLSLCRFSFYQRYRRHIARDDG